MRRRILEPARQVRPDEARTQCERDVVTVRRWSGSGGGALRGAEHPQREPTYAERGAHPEQDVGGSGEAFESIDVAGAILRTVAVDAVFLEVSVDGERPDPRDRAPHEQERASSGADQAYRVEIAARLGTGWRRQRGLCRG